MVAGRGGTHPAELSLAAASSESAGSALSLKRYWSVDLPGLDRSSAESLVRYAADAGMSDAGAAVDPREFLTLHLDKSTAIAVSAALSRTQVAEHSDNPKALIAAGFRELLDEWLEESR